ncbi:unnamed protein product, partial [Ixodes hexagonus]
MVTLYGLASDDSSKGLVRGVPLRFSHAEILANSDQSQFEIYSCRRLGQSKLVILTFAGLKGHTCEPLYTLCDGPHLTAARGCPKRFCEPYVLRRRELARQARERATRRDPTPQRGRPRDCS